ncbi:slipin family protein [Paludibaculum fermentans]|uniref:Slipin family protein n=1 Tax=Paludibaculum fermentans TaxID=1473598 RepID=A0A7S7NLI9_PALFE|nr:slipin family protein [Paludibaculum fermentans]QOY85334.1 slipin family protein [Paludibaculum fermentans]
MIWKRIAVGDRERVLVIRDGRFDTILGPGEHNLFVSPLTRLETVVCRTDGLIFESEWNRFLLKQRQDLIDTFFVLVETSDVEVAMVSADGRLFHVLPPARRALYWKGEVEVTAEVVVVIDAPEVPAAKLPALERLGSAAPVTMARVAEGQAGLLYLDNKFTRTLEAGKHAFWNASSPRVDTVDLRRQTMEIAGQDILTRDKVSLRVNISAEYQVADPVMAARSAKDPAALLYRALQLAVRRTLGHRTLDEVLADKTDVDETVAQEVREELSVCGLRVGAIALKDVILPGDVRDILNQVVTAEKQAQANIIRRREETAATRSLLNTARLMEENPLLVRLKELETLERVVEKVDRVTVTDGLAGLLTNLVTIK